MKKKSKIAQDLVQKRWSKTSPEQRSEMARKMALKRWSKKQKEK